MCPFTQNKPLCGGLRLAETIPFYLLGNDLKGNCEIVAIFFPRVFFFIAALKLE